MTSGLGVAAFEGALLGPFDAALDFSASFSTAFSGPVTAITGGVGSTMSGVTGLGVTAVAEGTLRVATGDVTLGVGAFEGGLVAAGVACFDGVAEAVFSELSTEH